jgi:hypothetical protein
MTVLIPLPGHPILQSEPLRHLPNALPSMFSFI